MLQPCRRSVTLYTDPCGELFVLISQELRGPGEDFNASREKSLDDDFSEFIERLLKRYAAREDRALSNLLSAGDIYDKYAEEGYEHEEIIEKLKPLFEINKKFVDDLKKSEEAADEWARQEMVLMGFDEEA